MIKIVLHLWLEDTNKCVYIGETIVFIGFGTIICYNFRHPWSLGIHPLGQRRTLWVHTYAYTLSSIGSSTFICNPHGDLHPVLYLSHGPRPASQELPPRITVLAGHTGIAVLLTPQTQVPTFFFSISPPLILVHCLDGQDAVSYFCLVETTPKQNNTHAFREAASNICHSCLSGGYSKVKYKDLEDRDGHFLPEWPPQLCAQCSLNIVVLQKYLDVFSL